MIENQRTILQTNYSMPSGKTMLSNVGNFWKGTMLWSGWNTNTSKVTARKPTRKSSRGNGDFSATVGISAQKCSIFVGIAARKCSIFVATNANVVVVRTPNCKDQKKKTINDETKLNWIKILSNPLFIGLEWLWRTKSNCPCEFCEKDRKLDGKEKKKKEDVIESSLHDAYLLDETSSLKHYNSRDVYRKSAEAYETFAAGVLEKASQNELYQIMDVKGEGCLQQNNPHQHRNFIQSLSLLKSAVNKRRKKVRAL